MRDRSTMVMPESGPGCAMPCFLDPRGYGVNSAEHVPPATGPEPPAGGAGLGGGAGRGCDGEPAHYVNSGMLRAAPIAATASSVTAQAPRRQAGPGRVVEGRVVEGRTVEGRAVVLSRGLRRINGGSGSCGRSG